MVWLMQWVPNQLASGFLTKSEGKEFHVSHFVHEYLGEGIGIVDRGVEGAKLGVEGVATRTDDLRVVGHISLYGRVQGMHQGLQLTICVWPASQKRSAAVVRGVEERCMVKAVAQRVGMVHQADLRGPFPHAGRILVMPGNVLPFPGAGKAYGRTLANDLCVVAIGLGHGHPRPVDGGQCGSVNAAKMKIGRARRFQLVIEASLPARLTGDGSLAGGTIWEYAPGGCVLGLHVSFQG